MAQPDVTATGIQEYADALNFAWVEFVDQEVLDATRNAIAALENLRTILIDYTG